MAARSIHLVALLVGLLGPGGAPAAAAPDHDSDVHGFMTSGGGEVTGRVIDAAGRPVPGAEVHIVSEGVAERLVQADNQGRFKTTVAAATAWVFVAGAIKVADPALVSTEGAGDIVEIHEAIPPAVLPRPHRDRRAIAPYSDRAIEHNAWLRAWLMFDVDDKGVVQRLKVLVSPGYDLDAIAIRESFALRFDPARDRSNQPIGALVVWSFDWPPYYWLLEHRDASVTRMPPDLRLVPCQGTGPTRTIYRDCARPVMSKAMEQPWIERPRR